MTRVVRWPAGTPVRITQCDVRRCAGAEGVLFRDLYCDDSMASVRLLRDTEGPATGLLLVRIKNLERIDDITDI